MQPDDLMLNQESSDRMALSTVKKEIESTPNHIYNNCTVK